MDVMVAETSHTLHQPRDPARDSTVLSKSSQVQSSSL
jgi:hypothetical protein